MSRFVVVERPHALPGSCMLTGKADDTYYIDTGIDIPFHGAVYIGSSALEEIAELIGWIKPDDYSELQNNNDALSSRLVTETKRNDHLQKALNELNSVGFEYRTFDSSPSSGGNVGLVSEQADVRNEDGREGGTPSVGEGEGESLESLDDEGVGELRSDTSIERVDSILNL